MPFLNTSIRSKKKEADKGKRTKKVEEEENIGSDEEDRGSKSENEVLFVAKGKKREIMKKKTKASNSKEKKLRNNASNDEDHKESESEEDVKKFKKVKKERAEEAQKLSKTMTYLTCNTILSPKALYDAMSGLSEVRKRCLKELGFKRYIHFLIVDLPSTLAYHVIENFHTPSMELRLQKGKTKLEDLEQRTFNDPFIREWEAQYSDLGKQAPPAIGLQISSTHEADFMFKMNFITHFESTMGTLENGGRVPIKLLKCIKEDDDIAEID
ncbi:hypothetical protein Tco_0514691 [Tanacetum coccineum]